jgi:hypothetical protein
MSKKYAWTKSIEDEIWRGGPCDSIRECVREACDEGLIGSDTFAIGYIEPYEINYDFAQDIVERLGEDAWDEVGEVSDGWLDSAKRPELDKLNEKILPIVLEWLKEIHEEPTFYRIDPLKECTLTEAMVIHDENIKIAPKGGKLI